MTDQHDPFEVDVALSFAAEDESIARQLADLLHQRGIRVFRDEYSPAARWGKDMIDHLVNLYARKARYCVLLISRHYPLKSWTESERTWARERALRDADEYVLPVLVDESDVPGISDNVETWTLGRHSLESIVDELEQRLAKTTPRSGPPPQSHDLRSGNVPSQE